MLLAGGGGLVAAAMGVAGGFFVAEVAGGKDERFLRRAFTVDEIYVETPLTSK